MYVGETKPEFKVSTGNALGARAKRKLIRSHKDLNILNSPWLIRPE